VAINPAGTRVYVTTGTDVAVVDTSTNTVIATVPVGGFPEGLDVTPDGLNVFVANSGAASVQVISTATNTVTATIPTGSGSAPFAFGKFIGGGGSAPPPPPPVANVPIPTLSKLALAVLMLLLGLAGIFALRRRVSG
jgi:YVTN family beta-propeller protein